MDLAASSAGPWLVLGVVLGVLLAGLAVLAVAGLRRPSSTAAEANDGPAPEVAGRHGWAVDDLPGFLDSPPGTEDPGGTTIAAAAHMRLTAGPLLLDPPAARPAARRAGSDGSDRTERRLLVALATASLLLVGTAAAVAAVTTEASSASSTAPVPAQVPAPGPTWRAPDVSGVPAEPAPGDPGAGRLAARSVPVGPDGALARAAFGGLVLERRGVGVTVAYPAVSVTATEVGRGPALAHVLLPSPTPHRTTPWRPAAGACLHGTPSWAPPAWRRLRTARTACGSAAPSRSTSARPGRRRSGPARSTG